MDYNNIIYEKQDQIGLITLNRPKSYNSINNELITELVDVFDTMESDDDISVVIITGNEKAFAAGASRYLRV